MQGMQSDTDSKESDSTTFEDARYKQNDYLAFIAFVDSMHDRDSDYDYTDEQNVAYLNNLSIQLENLI